MDLARSNSLILAVKRSRMVGSLYKVVTARFLFYHLQILPTVGVVPELIAKSYYVGDLVGKLGWVRERVREHGRG